ncbi:hypothetical protein RMSM_05867 [Rhodopirellula maiorica SM1]|uniref:Uncharacterized protein n=1 Tax=Rhodopirellula maiorica SM1 TaxID=1265738 RepID=M5RP95_9BACT|nr:hypothetical protein [Rhodopirellula maiorica]EMI17207.1 hypothetical protein RMSM_05867 [Rhodopirellula maiorica SM1]
MATILIWVRDVGVIVVTAILVAGDMPLLTAEDSQTRSRITILQDLLERPNDEKLLRELLADARSRKVEWEKFADLMQQVGDHSNHQFGLHQILEIENKIDTVELRLAIQKLDRKLETSENLSLLERHQLIEELETKKSKMVNASNKKSALDKQYMLLERVQRMLPTLERKRQERLEQWNRNKRRPRLPIQKDVPLI